MRKRLAIALGSATCAAALAVGGGPVAAAGASENSGGPSGGLAGCSTGGAGGGPTGGDQVRAARAPVDQVQADPAACPHGEIKANDVLFIGDSFLAASRQIRQDVEAHARMINALGPNEMYRDASQSGAVISARRWRRLVPVWPHLGAVAVVDPDRDEPKRA